MTAPLWFVKYSDDADVAAGYAVAEVLHADPDPVVHKPVGIYLAYAGERLPEQPDGVPRPVRRRDAAAGVPAGYPEASLT